MEVVPLSMSAASPASSPAPAVAVVVRRTAVSEPAETARYEKARKGRRHRTAVAVAAGEGRSTPLGLVVAGSRPRDNQVRGRTVGLGTSLGRRQWVRRRRRWWLLRWWRRRYVGYVRR